jgi:predicted RNA-binding Zn-ribbon protein involved in translation (DUF1610 family)
MYSTETETPTARKPHICMSCGERINAGEKYTRWRCYDDGDAGTNKMHPECYAMHCADAEGSTWEYAPFSYERPTAQEKP